MEYPTPFQKKTLWMALTGLAVLTIAGIFIFIIYLTGRTLSFLQPILIPVAVAGVIAYLLEPIVDWMVKHRIPRLRAVILVFAVVLLSSASILFWLVPTVYRETVRLGREVPEYIIKARVMVDEGVQKYTERLPNFGPFKRLRPPAPSELTPRPILPADADAAAVVASEAGAEKVIVQDPYTILFGPEAQEWIEKQIPIVSQQIWEILKGSVGGLLGVIGFIIGLFIIPIYLFFFLVEAENISNKWTRFVPLRASHFKDEVVSVLAEINSYIIAFFRGQLLVSIIDGILTGILLLLLGLPFALLIGLMVCILCLIPYVGIIICWIPAVIIAAVEFKDWQHPLYVTLIFIGVQQIEGIFIAPKIVGDSVGLHPMTVIISVFTWVLLLGGLLGAILAIPLTATLKVLLGRYVWQRKADDRLIVTESGT